MDTKAGGSWWQWHSQELANSREDFQLKLLILVTLSFDNFIPCLSFATNCHHRSGTSDTIGGHQSVVRGHEVTVKSSSVTSITHVGTASTPSDAYCDVYHQLPPAVGSIRMRGWPRFHGSWTETNSIASFIDVYASYEMRFLCPYFVFNAPPRFFDLG